VDTAEDFFVRLYAVADDTAVTVRANRRKRVDCALEAVESVTLSAHDHFKRCHNRSRKLRMYAYKIRSLEALSAAVFNFSDTET
jgi:hypothetical protein